MPIRKIPKNHIFVTGNFSSKKNGAMGQFESLLEKEFMLLLDFDDKVKSFEEQPVRIPLGTRRRFYVPDILVHYNPDPVTNEIPPPFLTEVKHSDDIARNHEKYAEKFSTAAKFAEQQGWTFGITTEKQIRTARLANIKFLREFRNITPTTADRNHVLRMVAEMPEPNLKTLLHGLSSTEEDRLRWTPVIWHLVLTRDIITDFDMRIDSSTTFRLPA